MNIISTILAKESIKENNPLNILWTPCDNSNFTNYIMSLNHNLYNYEHLYFGTTIPNIIICNNKMYSHAQIKNLSLNYHLPVLIVDHAPRDSSIDIDIALKNINNFPCSYKIAINQRVYDSWAGSHDEIIPIDNNDRWEKIIYQTAKRTYVL